MRPDCLQDSCFGSLKLLGLLLKGGIKSARIDPESGQRLIGAQSAKMVQDRRLFARKLPFQINDLLEHSLASAKGQHVSVQVCKILAMALHPTLLFNTMVFAKHLF